MLLVQPMPLNPWLCMLLFVNRTYRWPYVHPRHCKQLHEPVRSHSGLKQWLSADLCLLASACCKQSGFLCSRRFAVSYLQVNIGLRVLTRPSADRLPDIYRNLGLDYAERILPSIIQVGRHAAGSAAQLGPAERRHVWPRLLLSCFECLTARSWDTSLRCCLGAPSTVFNCVVWCAVLCPAVCMQPHPDQNALFGGAAACPAHCPQGFVLSLPDYWQCAYRLHALPQSITCMNTQMTPLRWCHVL